jgi:hypothetical protein
MLSKKLTAADRYDTWDADWEGRLSAHVRSSGLANVWEYVRGLPGEAYVELAERLCASGGFGVAPVQVERLQARDTPDAELSASIRDSLVRHLRYAFKVYGWRQGPYWESRAIGALASWTAMWSARIDLGPHRHRLFELGAPEDWTPRDERDPYLLTLVPDQG